MTTDSFKKNYTEIKDCLNAIAEEGLKFNIDIYLKKFKNREYFTKFESQFKDFQHDIKLAVDDAQREIKSPIYVGVVGHYSHGKSSLLNALLFPPKSKDLLPTGESIVTSLCTLVQFKADSNTHEFYEVTPTGQETNIHEDDYQTKVSGKRTGSVRDLSHFRIVLGTDNLSGTIFEDMAGKQVELFDTPGLGGPYWNDEEALQQWIKEFLLLIVCIKADKINANTASVVNPFLKQTARPVILGVTFWDLWQKTPGYENISDEKNARDKAKEDIKRFFPTLTDAVDDGRIFFVSSKNCQEEVPIPDENNHLISENWNVDNLRQNLTQFINERKNILISQRPQESYIDKNRRAGIVATCKSLTGKFASVQEALNKAIERSRPPAENGGIEELKEKFEEFSEETLLLFGGIVDKLESSISDGLSAMEINGQWGESFRIIQEQTSNQFRELRTGELPDKIKRLAKRHIESPTERFLEKTPLSSEQQKKIRDEIRDKIDEFIYGINHLETNIFIPPSGVQDLTINVVKGVWSGVQQLMVTNVPLLIGIVAAWSALPFLLRFIPFKVLIFIGVVLGIITIGIFWSQFQSSIQKTALEVKDKARRNNRIANIKQRIIDEAMQKALDDFQKDLAEEISDRLTPVIDQSEEMFAEVKYIMKKLYDETKKIDRECSELTRQGRI